MAAARPSLITVRYPAPTDALASAGSLVTGKFARIKRLADRLTNKGDHDQHQTHRCHHRADDPDGIQIVDALGEQLPQLGVGGASPKPR